jgi:radical SAM superfamily enzyme YgiQ (UPF0313 family)
MNDTKPNNQARKVLLIGPMGGSDKMYYSPPLGIHRLRSYMERNGIECLSVDPTIETIPASDEFDVIGYSVLGWSVNDSIDHANKLDLRDDQIVVFGGYEATFNYAHIIERCKIPNFAMALGEAEDALLHIAKTGNREPHAGLIWARDGKQESFAHGTSLSKQQFADLTLNMDYEAIPYQNYWQTNESKIGDDFDPYETRVIRLYLKNRCGFTCDFCSSANFHTAASGEKPAVLTIEPENVADLLVRLVKSFPDVRTFFFQDDEIFAPRTFIRGLLENIIERPELKDISFICQGRVDAIHPSLFSLMKQAGFRTAILGLENFSQDVLTELAPGKIVGSRSYDDRLKKLLEWGIMPFINIILTTPGTKMKDILINLKQCIKELERGCELGVNLYTNNWAGSAMADRENYISEGFNFLPSDQDVRELLPKVEQLYQQFRNWALETYVTPNIKSSTRSLMFLFFISHMLDQPEELERCKKLFTRFAILPNVPDDEQVQAIMVGLNKILAAEDYTPVNPWKLPFPEVQERLSQPGVVPV